MRSVLSKQEIVHCLHNGWTPVLVPPLVFPNFILRWLFTIIGCRKFKNLLKDTTFIHTQMLVCKGQYSILTTFSPEKVLVGAFSEYCEYQCQYCEESAASPLVLGPRHSRPSRESAADCGDAARCSPRRHLVCRHIHPQHCQAYSRRDGTTARYTIILSIVTSIQMCKVK